MKAALREARVVDIHAHAVLRETLGAAGPWGPEIGATEDGKPWFRIGEYLLRNVRYEGGAFMEPVPGTRRWRAILDLTPGDGNDPVELRLYIRGNGAALTETWLYQFRPVR